MHIDGSYYITVREFKKRQYLMDKQIKKYNLNITKFFGVNKKYINNNYLFNNRLIKRPIKYKEIGSVACLVSHINLYKKIYNENKDNDKEIFLILEDDAVLCPNFLQKLNFYYDFIPDNWDMVWLGYNKLKGDLINKYIMKPKNNPGVGYNAQHHCYLIKKSSIPKILNILIPIYYISKYTKDGYLRLNFHRFNAYFVIDKLSKQNLQLESKRKLFGGLNG